MSPARHPCPQFISPILATQCRQDDVTGAFHYTPLNEEDSAYSSDFESSDAESGGCYVSSADEEEFHASRVFEENDLNKYAHVQKRNTCLCRAFLLLIFLGLVFVVRRMALAGATASAAGAVHGEGARGGGFLAPAHGDSSSEESAGCCARHRGCVIASSLVGAAAAAGTGAWIWEGARWCRVQEVTKAPAPAQLVPAQPVPAQPVPAQPVPAQPVPVQPVPVQPAPEQSAKEKEKAEKQLEGKSPIDIFSGGWVAQGWLGNKYPDSKDVIGSDSIASLNQVLEREGMELVPSQNMTWAHLKEALEKGAGSTLEKVREVYAQMGPRDRSKMNHFMQRRHQRRELSYNNQSHMLDAIADLCALHSTRS